MTENQNKTRYLEERIKAAYAGNRFTEVKTLAAEIQSLDPQNFVAGRLQKKVRDLELAAKANLERKKQEVLKPKKPGILIQLAKWLKSRNSAKKTPIVKPAELKQIPQQPRPVILSPVPQKPAEPQSDTTKPIVAAPTAPALAPAQDSQENIFTKMFGKKEAVEAPKTKSIIETIVSKTATEEKTPASSKTILAAKQQKDPTASGFLRLANTSLQFAVAFIVITAVFFYAQNIDTENRIFSMFNRENYASRLHQSAGELEELKTQERALDREIKKYESGYNNRFEDVIRQIVENRLNWPDILAKINEITETVYERNALSQYIQYSGFSFDAQNGTVQVSGTLSDPLGKNLTKLEELEQAFRAYPKDPANPSDQTKPYFYDLQELNSLRKSFDTRTGRYISSFQLSFSLKPKNHK